MANRKVSIEVPAGWSECRVEGVQLNTAAQLAVKAAIGAILRFSRARMEVVFEGDVLVIRKKSGDHSPAEGATISFETAGDPEGGARE